MLIFIAPFVYLYRYIIPNAYFSRMLDNDFAGLYYNYKPILLDTLSRWKIPLWSPSEACGFPFYSSPFTQTFYPLNLPLTLFYKWFGGYSYHDHQIFTVLGISIFALGLYGWLGSLDVDRRYALFASLIVSTSCKITEILRFPNAVHTIAWLPFVLWGCTLAVQQSRQVKGGLLLSGALLMMLTAGYPYYVYYSLFLICPYILLLLISGSRRALIGDRPAQVKKFVLTLVISGIVVFLMVLPYLIKMVQLLSQTTDRGGTNFKFSTEHEFTFSDTLGSLFFPPASQMEGWYYFGMAALLVIIVYGLHVVLKNVRPREAWLFVVALAWWWFISYITYGRHSYLFKLFWFHIPGFSFLRVWGRMNIILLPVLALLLAKSYAFIENWLAQKTCKKWNRTFVLFLLTYLIILFGQLYFFSQKKFDPYWSTYFLPSAGKGFDERCFLISGGIAFILLCGFFWISRLFSLRSHVFFNLAMFCIIAFNMTDVGRVATKQWSIEGSAPTTRTTFHADRMALASLKTPRIYEYDTISQRPVFFAGYIINWYFKRYVEFLQKYGSPIMLDKIFGQKYGSPIESLDTNSTLNDFKRLLGIRDGQRFYFSKSIRHATIHDFLSDADSCSLEYGVTTNVEKYDGDALVVRIQTAQKGYFSFIDNWDRDWHAIINGQNVKIDTLFGTFKSVVVPKGCNTVAFVYKPALAWRKTETIMKASAPIEH